MGRGIPEADLPVMAASEELMSQGVDSQPPQLICMTLEERRGELSRHTDSIHIHVFTFVL